MSKLDVSMLPSGSLTRLFALIPLLAVVLGVWVLAWVGAYPHHDLGAVYATIIGTLAVIGGGLLTVLALALPSIFRVVAGVLGLIPILIGVVGLFLMVDLDSSGKACEVGGYRCPGQPAQGQVRP